MSDDPIILGSTEAGPLDLNLDRLIGAHLGIVANSGGGKSGLIRKLLEVTAGLARALVTAKSERPDRVKAGVTAGETALNQAGQKMLDMLDHIAPAKVSWASLAAMCKYKPRGGNFNAARKAMRESGCMVEEGEFVRSVQAPGEGMSREAARQLWKEVLSSPAPEMIDALHVKPMTRQALADFLGKAARGGHWNGGISQLLRNGVVVETGGRLELASPLPGESQ